MEPTNRNARWTISRDALTLVICIGIFNWFILFLSSTHMLLDFATLYTGGGLVAEGHRALLFDMPMQMEFQHRVLRLTKFFPFNHLAYESLLFAPLALLPFKYALWIWRILSVGMLMLGTRQLADLFHAARAHIFWIAVCCFPVGVAVVQGQDSLLLLLLLSSAMTCLKRDQDTMAGFLLALALFKPQLILPIAAILIWRRGYKFICGFLFGAALVVGLSTAVTGFKGWQQMTTLWRYDVSSAADQISSFAKSMPNLRGILSAVGLSADAALVFSAVLSVLLFMLVAWQLRREHSPLILFPPLVALTRLLSPHVNAHDLSILLIPILALFVTEKKSASICASVCFCYPLFLIVGHTAFFFFVICAVLWMTLITGRSECPVDAQVAS